jgi:hypothetical protein
VAERMRLMEMLFAGPSGVFQLSTLFRELRDGERVAGLRIAGLAEFLQLMGELHLVMKLRRIQWTLSVALHGPLHMDTLTSVNYLATNLYQLGEYAEARGLYDRTLAGRESVLGPMHADTLASPVHRLKVLCRRGFFRACCLVHDDSSSGLE